jgi:hypothetical protein
MPGAASACTCAAEKPKVKLARADGAFNGRLLGITPDADGFNATFRYRVNQVFKGQLSRGTVVEIRSGNSDAVCGLTRKTGKVYGLLVDRKGGKWWGSICNTLSPGQLRRAARKAAEESTKTPAGCAGQA